MSGQEGTKARAWSELPARRRVLRVLAAALVAFHVVAMVATGAPRWLRDPLWPVVHTYANVLNLTNRWVMFGHPGLSFIVRVVAVREDGSSFDVATNLQNERSPWRRIVDVRLRRIQTNLLRGGLRTYGDSYLGYWCRVAWERDPDVVALRVTKEQPAWYDRDGIELHRAKRWQLRSVDCVGAPND